MNRLKDRQTGVEEESSREDRRVQRDQPVGILPREPDRAKIKQGEEDFKNDKPIYVDVVATRFPFLRARGDAVFRRPLERAAATRPHLQCGSQCVEHQPRAERGKRDDVRQNCEPTFVKRLLRDRHQRDRRERGEVEDDRDAEQTDQARISF